MRWCASASPFPIEARFSMQPFALRRRGPILRLVPVTGSTLLAYIFEAILKSTPQPVRFQTPVPVRPFYCLARYDQCLKPVAGVKPPDFPPVFEPPLPSRTFLSFGIKALNPTPFGNARLYESPDGVRIQAQQGWCFKGRLPAYRSTRLIASQLRYACWALGGERVAQDVAHAAHVVGAVDMAHPFDADALHRADDRVVG
jgi:hypothetical protein